MKNITNLALSIVLLSSTVSSPVTVLADSVKTETVTNINKKNLGHVGTKASNSEGMWGTSSLTFTPSTGVLIIGAGEASGTLSEAMRITSGHSLQEVKTISFSGKVVAPVDSSMLFSGATQVTKCEIGENLDTSKVTNMSAMFFDVGSTNLDLSHFDTSKVTDMSGMFEYAKLTSLDLTGFDTSKVTDMSEMFKDTMSLTSLDLTGFDTSKVTNMNAMFFFAEGLTTLDLSHFDTSKVTDMHLIFACMISLERLDITGFDTLNVVMHGDADNAFGNDVNLEELKLGTKFKFKKTPTTDNMGLPEHEDINFVTEKWQNVGTGTIDKPNGSNEWTSAEFMANYDGLKDAGTYVWQPKAVQGADVTVKYVDEAGQSITKDVIKTGNVGDKYTTEQKAITGYTLKEVTGGTTGSFTDKEQTVTYVYVKDSNSQESEKPTIPVIPKNPNDQGTTENMKQTNKQGIIVNSGDQKNKELPQTDEMNSTWLVILGGFLLVASFGLIDLKKRKD